MEQGFEITDKEQKKPDQYSEHQLFFPENLYHA